MKPLATISLAVCAITACAPVATPPAQTMPTKSQEAERACATYRAMMTAPMPPSETAKLRRACEAALKAERP